MIGLPGRVEQSAGEGIWPIDRYVVPYYFFQVRQVAPVDAELQISSRQGQKMLDRALEF